MAGLRRYAGAGVWRDLVKGTPGPGGPDPAFSREAYLLAGGRPTRSTTGVLPGIPRTPLYPNDSNGRYYIMQVGEEIRDRDLYGGLRPAQDCKAWNIYIHGWFIPIASVVSNTGYGMLNLLTGNVNNFLGEHITIDPDFPSPAYTGVRGAGGTLRFLYVAHQQDGTMVYRAAGSQALTLTVEHALFEHPLMTNPDPTRGDGDQTHADVGTQQEGASILFKFVYIIGWDVEADGNYAATELNGGGVACWMITGNQYATGTPPDRIQNCRFEDGWMRGGNIPINITPRTERLPVNGVHILRSKIGYGLHNYGGSQPYKHIVRPPGMNLVTTGSVGWAFNDADPSLESSTGALVLGNAIL